MQRPNPGCARRRGFSLVELLIVLLIIVLIIAIVIPALGGARRAAKDAATRNLMQNLNQSSSSFILSERRAPGYFSPAEMGGLENETQCFSGMQNVMLDLAGGILTDDANPEADDVTVILNPSNPNSRVKIRPDLIGVPSSGKAYFSPDPRYFKRQNGVEGGLRAVAAATTTYDKCPELVDANGMPILMWPIDPTAIDRASATDATKYFARQNSGNPAGTNKARAYWATNAAYLAGTSVGSKARNQAAGSLLSNSNPTEMRHALTALTGSPNAPLETVDVAVQDYVPAAARGQFVIHAAGADGFYLGVNDKGAKTKGGAELFYGLNFKAAGSGAGAPGHMDAQGKPENIDVISKFDDIISAGGG